MRHAERVNDILIRDASAADRTACIELWVRAAAARDGVEVPGVAERAEAKFNNRILWLIAEAAGGAAAFALATSPGSGAPTDPVDAAVLGMLGVSPAAQGAGLGRRMLRAATARLRDGGYRQAVLHVLTDNTAAVRLYESEGWRPFGEPFDHPLLHRPSQAYSLHL